jgi:N-glycosidase YbiA
MLILPKHINQSYCYIADNFTHRGLVKGWGLECTLSEWVSQSAVSKALFGESGVRTVRACEEHFGPFVWATEFANVHSTFYFEPKPIVVDGEEYANSEAYYQCMKSFGQPDHEQAKAIIRNANPMDAFSLGQKYSRRPEWFDVSVEVMRKAVKAKFTQDDPLCKLLLSTWEHPLVHIKGDSFWGSGYDGRGQNMLGVLLQDLRSQMRQGIV